MSFTFARYSPNLIAVISLTLRKGYRDCTFSPALTLSPTRLSMMFNSRGSVRSGTPLVRVLYRDSKHVHRHSCKNTFDECLVQVSLSFLSCFVSAYPSVGLTLNHRLRFDTIPDPHPPVGTGKKISTMFRPLLIILLPCRHRTAGSSQHRFESRTVSSARESY